MGLNEKQKEEMKIETRKLLDSFAKSLSKVKLASRKEETSSLGFREKSEMKADSDFKERMFANAPKTSGDFIIAEKKQW